MSENTQFTDKEHYSIQSQLDRWLSYPSGRLTEDETDLISAFDNIPVEYPSFMSGFVLGCMFFKKNFS